MIGERRMLFEKRFTVYTEFSRLGDLETGAPVRVAGAEAGEVTDIEIPATPSAKFRVKMEVREALHPIIRTDSIAVPQTRGARWRGLHQHRRRHGSGTAASPTTGRSRAASRSRSATSCRRPATR